MDYGEVLGRAWRIIWKHKILWIFGIFAGCSRGGGGGGNGGGSGGRVTNPGGFNPGFEQYGNQFSNYISSHWWIIIVFILAVLVLAILFAMLGAMGRIGLIRGTAKADAGAEHLGFMELWDEARPYFWRIFLLSLLVLVAVLIVVLPIIGAGVAFTAITLGIGLLCLLPLICVLVIALWVLQLIIQQAEIAIVLENLGLNDGLRRGWEVIRKNLGPVLLMWLILLVIAFIAGIAIALPILVVFVPAIFTFAISANSSSNVSFAPLLIGLGCFVVYLPFLIVLNGILMAYLQSAWTLTYMRLTKPKENTITESPVIQAPNA